MSLVRFDSTVSCWSGVCPLFGQMVKGGWVKTWTGDEYRSMSQQYSSYKIHTSPLSEQGHIVTQSAKKKKFSLETNVRLERGEIKGT